jgi:alpha-ribazole phosphatase
MPEKMKAFFARHGETNYNVQGLCNSDPGINVHLTEKGRSQACEMSEQLKDEQISMIFVSELPRTMETAGIINELHQAPIRIDARINDRRTGFEGRPVDEFLRAVEEDRFNLKLNDGESFQEEKDRVFSFLSDLSRLDYKAVLVISHMETMQIIAGYYYDLSDAQMLDVEMKNGQILEVDISDWRGY